MKTIQPWEIFLHTGDERLPRTLLSLHVFVVIHYKYNVSCLLSNRLIELNNMEIKCSDFFDYINTLLTTSRINFEGV